MLPTKIADLTTLVPGGGGATFASYPPNPLRISGGNVAFIAVSSAGLPDVYFWPPDPSIGGRVVADTNTVIPGAGGKFARFLDLALSGTNVAFIGAGASTDPTPGGVYFYPVDPTGAFPVADSATPVPGQPVGTFFTGFQHVSLAGSTVAFAGSFAQGSGVYVKTPGDPCRLLANSSFFARSTMMSVMEGAIPTRSSVTKTVVAPGVILQRQPFAWISCSTPLDGVVRES